MLRNEGTKPVLGVCADVRVKLGLAEGIAYNTIEQMQIHLSRRGIADDNINTHRKMRHVEKQGNEIFEFHQCALPSCGSHVGVEGCGS